MSPAIAIVAIVFSVLSLRVARDSLRSSTNSFQVGQRAYLSVSGGTISLPRGLRVLQKQFGFRPFRVPPGMGPRILDATNELEVTNFGTTPATVTELALDYHVASSDWIMVFYPRFRQGPVNYERMTLRITDFGDVGPRAVVRKIYRLRFRLPPSEANSYMAAFTSGGQGPPGAEGAA